jgi:CTP synthase (UTP-ammonia lyase)
MEKRLIRVVRLPSEADIAITEVGAPLADIEGQPYLEANTTDASTEEGVTTSSTCT